ncbi:hypothetical protein AcW1_003217 [Taiwanofungus camphoratus]|nr:hypothetical protein AcW1_003217 [Antrodia cinnamomea]
MAQYSHLSTPDPEFAALLAHLPSIPPWYEVEDAALLRQQFNAGFIGMIQNNLRPKLPPKSAYRLQDHQVPVEGDVISVRCLTPTSQEKEAVFPLLFWIHGGGWNFGNLDTDDYYLRILCVDLQIAIVNVEYRLAPEHPFPTGLNDCYAALKWAADRSSLFSASLSRGFLIGGQSSGANLAAVIAHRARDDAFFAGRRLTGQVLQVPIVLHPDAYPEKYKSELLSMEQNKDAPFLDRKQLDEFYRRVQVQPSNPECSPLLFPSHNGLPPTYIQVCGLDPLRDEGLLYEKVLREEGVKTKVDVYPGVAHGFQLSFPALDAAVKLDSDFKNGIRLLLMS